MPDSNDMPTRGPSPGDDLPHRVQRTLGEGFLVTRELRAGMSRVFVVRDATLERDIIVKLLTPETAEGVSAERFTREARTLARLQHPHIVPILSAGRVGDVPFYTMPYVSGESLRAALKNGPLDPRRVVGILRDVARALDFAHRQGIVHRDIKPDNILMSGNAAVVSDFGIAKALSDARLDAGTETLTRVGTSIGTPAYMAPEQALTDPGVDHRADIYSLGVTAWELLTGELPFGGSVAEMMKAHVTVPAPELSARRPDVPGSLTRLVMRCLEKEPDRRPQSAADILAALDDASGERVPTATKRRWPRPAIPVALVAAAMLAVLLVPRLRGAASNPRSVVVLPFENLSGDSAVEYFSDGMTEQLVGDLGRANGLRVASRAASFSYKGRRADPRQVAREQHVETVVTGSVRRDGGRIRLDVELVDAEGKRRWARQYDHTLDNVFATQEEVARDITSELKASLSPGRSPAQATDGETYDRYLQARHRMRRARSREAMDSVIRDLRGVLARDSTFAPAWGQLAQGYRSLSEYQLPTTVLPLAKAAAVRAAHLDPSDAEAGLALAAMIFNVDWDWLAAEREFRRVIRLHPEHAGARSAYVGFLRASRRVDEAVEQLNAQHEIERRTVTDTARLRARQLANRGWIFAHTERYAEADSFFRTAIAMDSTSWELRWSRAMVLVAHDPSSAVLELERVRAAIGDRLPQLTHLGVAYGMAGRRDSTRQIRDRLLGLSQRSYVPKDQFAALALALGDRENALRWLERAIDERHYWLPYINGNPMFDALRYDARYRALLKRIGVPDAAL